MHTGSKLPWLAAVIAVVIGAAALLPDDSADAHSAGFLWDTNLTMKVDHISGGFWDGAVLSAVIDYNTKVPSATLGLSLCSGCHNVGVYKANLGTGVPAGRALPRDAGSLCYNYPGFGYTGNCGTSGSARADSGRVNFNNNSFITPLLSSTSQGFIIRHELGHHGGFDHVSCSTNSVMKAGGCSGSFPSSLQSHDQTEIATHY